jgi:hypothetical protein
MSLVARVSRTLGLPTAGVTTDQLLAELSQYGEVWLYSSKNMKWQATIELPPAFPGAEAKIRTDYNMATPRAALEQLWARLQQVAA